MTRSSSWQGDAIQAEIVRYGSKRGVLGDQPEVLLGGRQVPQPWTGGGSSITVYPTCRRGSRRRSSAPAQSAIPVPEGAPRDDVIPSATAALTSAATRARSPGSTSATGPYQFGRTDQPKTCSTESGGQPARCRRRRAPGWGRRGHHRQPGQVGQRTTVVGQEAATEQSGGTSHRLRLLRHSPPTPVVGAPAPWSAGDRERRPRNCTGCPHGALRAGSPGCRAAASFQRDTTSNES